MSRYFAGSPDPDARLGRKYGETTLGYKDHRTVDDPHGIITSTVTTPANINDRKRLSEAIESHQANTGVDVCTAVADKEPCLSHKIMKYCLRLLRK